MGVSSSVDVAAGSSASVRSESIDMLPPAHSCGCSEDRHTRGRRHCGVRRRRRVASVADATAEVRGDASLASAGAASLSGESATVATSGNITASAPGMKVHTDELELIAPRLRSTTAETASLLTTDANICLRDSVRLCHSGRCAARQRRIHAVRRP